MVSFEVVEVTLRIWDAHMAGCPVCLVEGQRLCYEGEYLTEQVVTARHAARVDADRRDWISLPTRNRRPTLPGVVA